MKFHFIKIFALASVVVLSTASCRHQSAPEQEQEGELAEMTSFFDTSLSQKSKKKNKNKNKQNQQQQNAKHNYDNSAVNTGLVAGGKNGQLLKRTAYTVSYNKDTRCANWVAWVLTSNHTSGSFKRDGHKFKEDNEVPTPRATNDDYYRSGYNRGHLCPSGDNKWSEKTQSESFFFTNISPMRRDLDGGDWNELEMKCRSWANKYGKLYIACGPVYKNQEHKKIGKNKVVVPEQYFKVVMTFGKDGNSPKALGFIYDNRSGRNDLSYYVRSVDEIERITGFDFFPFLDDTIENRIEANPNLRDW